MAGRFVFPVHNQQGELIGYAGRAIDDELAKTDGKYKTPFHKSRVLYNPHRVLKLETRVCILVEGFFSTLKIHQAGFPNVVASMGAKLYERQEDLLVENFGSVVIIGDGDKSGRDFVADTAPRLIRKMFVCTVDMPDGTQPDKLASEEIRELLSDIT